MQLPGSQRQVNALHMFLRHFNMNTPVGHLAGPIGAKTCHNLQTNSTKMKTNQTEGGGTPQRLTHLLLTHSSCPLSRQEPPVHNVTRQKWETLINHPANPMRIRLSITHILPPRHTTLADLIMDRPMESPLPTSCSQVRDGLG